ncbi:Hypothetical predicted protein [Paramuricea clavata]|uniref:DUF6589 domain-containing protein n=1 Tax=Paramuricea clavata TaxID=317549 RepID=A0A6S7GA75_PARCT|nr:Hypothetical predicted protein [Paramuricea clavata]
MLLDHIGQRFLERAVELVKSGYKFVFVLDNIDWEERVHDMRKDNQNTSVHAVATTIVFNRVPDEKLPDSEPQQDLRKCNVYQLVKLTASEIESIRKQYHRFVQDLLFEHFPFFSSYQSSLPNNSTCCRYSDEMAMKSETITMPVLMKDEKKYAECVDVLDKLEDWTHQKYTLLLDCANQVNQPLLLIQFVLRPYPHLQVRFLLHPYLQLPVCFLLSLYLPLPVLFLLYNSVVDLTNLPHISHLLHLVKIHCAELEFLVFGDQLTRIRLAGAKDLHAGCHTARQRLDHLYPFCIVDWHTKRSYLKDAVKSGNGEYLEVLRKQLLVHFFSTPGYEFAIEMLINILQYQVLLTEAEAHQCKWAATVNWNGGSGKNIEIDLFQENQNSEMKKLIKSMGANKSEQAISRAILSHSHKSALNDDTVILGDLRDLRPFKKVVGREFESFQDISANPTKKFDSAKFQTWIKRHTKNILLHYPVFDNDDEDDSEDDNEDVFDDIEQ